MIPHLSISSSHTREQDIHPSVPKTDLVSVQTAPPAAEPASPTSSQEVTSEETRPSASDAAPEQVSIHFHYT